jgi:hypothetical protein
MRRLLPVMGAVLLGTLGTTFAYSHGNWAVALAVGAAALALYGVSIAIELLYVCVGRIDVLDGLLVRTAFPRSSKRIASDKIGSVRRATLRQKSGLTFPAWIVEPKSGAALFWMSAEYWDGPTIEKLAATLKVLVTGSWSDEFSSVDSDGKFLPMW